MSKQSDFLELMTLLWNVEELDMCYSKEHIPLAFLIDRLYGTIGYKDLYQKWMSLAENGDFNEFVWSILQTVLSVTKYDSSLDANTRRQIEVLVESSKPEYDDQELCVMGILSESFAPDWFWEIYEAYMDLEDIKRKNVVKSYMIEVAGSDPVKAEENYKKMYDDHHDIFNEFYFFVRNKRFKSFYPITAKGYTAKFLHENASLSPLDAFNYLIYLRESPEKATAELKFKLQ